MTGKPRRIETAGTWRPTGEGMIYAAVARSGDEVLARADFTLMMSVDEGEDPAEMLPRATRVEIEREIEEVVRQQAVRILDRRRRGGPRATDGPEG